MTKNPILNPIASSDQLETQLEHSIRPKKLAHYIGQKGVREQMSIFIQAARSRREALDHTLLFGPPGLGKTTLAHIISNEMNANLKQTSGPVIEKAGDLAALLTNLESFDILFIDEIHRLPRSIEEILYSAMEDYQLDIMIGEGPSARSIKIDIAPFTLIGATTRAGLLTAPLRDRFGIIQRLEFYSIHELTQIVTRSAHILNIKITEKGATEIAKRARGTPRICNRLLRRIRDYTQVLADGQITEEIANKALDLFQVDIHGFDLMDRKLLLTLIEKFNGGPAGVESLAAAIGEEAGTIEEVIEPFLIQQGFINRTPRGRVATEQAYHHFGLTLT